LVYYYLFLLLLLLLIGACRLFHIVCLFSIWYWWYWLWYWCPTFALTFWRLSKRLEDIWLSIFCDFCKPVIIHPYGFSMFLTNLPPDSILWYLKFRRCCDVFGILFHRVLPVIHLKVLISVVLSRHMIMVISALILMTCFNRFQQVLYTLFCSLSSCICFSKLYRIDSHHDYFSYLCLYLFFQIPITYDVAWKLWSIQCFYYIIPDCNDSVSWRT